MKGIAMEAIHVEQDGAVAVITIDRPAVLNALDPPALAALLAAVEEAATDDDVRAIVLTGGPRAFSTGEDLVNAVTLDAAAFRRQIDDFQRLATLLRSAPKAVIAAIAGPAYGGGIEIAVNCDIRIAATNARFCCPELEWSLTLSNGSSVLLRRLVGEGWARELLLLGAVLDAEAALRIGLVTRVVEPDALGDAALAIARIAASRPPVPVGLTKELLNADPRGWQETIDAEADAVCAALAAPGGRDRLEAFAARHR